MYSLRLQKSNDCNKDKPSVNKWAGTFITYGLENKGSGLLHYVNELKRLLLTQMLHYVITSKLDFSIYKSYRL